MSYVPGTLIARRQSMGNVLTDIWGGVKAGVQYGVQSEQQKGALIALTSQQPAMAAQSSGMGDMLMPLLVVGGLGVAAVLLLKKKGG